MYRRTSCNSQKHRAGKGVTKLQHKSCKRRPPSIRLVHTKWRCGVRGPNTQCPESRRGSVDYEMKSWIYKDRLAFLQTLNNMEHAVRKVIFSLGIMSLGGFQCKVAILGGNSVPMKRLFLGQELILDPSNFLFGYMLHLANQEILIEQQHLNICSI